MNKMIWISDMERVETIRFINKPASKKRKYLIQQTKEFPHTILFSSGIECIYNATRPKALALY